MQVKPRSQSSMRALQSEGHLARLLSGIFPPVALDTEPWYPAPKITLRQEISARDKSPLLPSDPHLPPPSPQHTHTTHQNSKPST